MLSLKLSKDEVIQYKQEKNTWDNKAVHSESVCI